MNYFEWKRSASRCTCGWSGPNSSLSNFETFDELFEYFCPRCGTKLGFVIYPDRDQVLEAASRGDPEAISMAERRP